MSINIIQSQEMESVHVAIIMDGNNRWAKQRDLPGISGHRAGADKLKNLLESFTQFPQIKILTVFAFSSENWSRSKQEVGALMSLFYTSLKTYRKLLIKNDIQLRVIGDRTRFSERLKKLINAVEKDTQDGKFVLNIAADYGGRWDMAMAAKQMSQQVLDGNLKVEDINEQELGKYLQLSDLPDPDLLIRTGGDIRISNFMLWQLAYAEIYFANCYWPDFDVHWMKKALDVYYERNRRYGGSGEGEEYQIVNQLRSAQV